MIHVHIVNPATGEIDTIDYPDGTDCDLVDGHLRVTATREITIPIPDSRRRDRDPLTRTDKQTRLIALYAPGTWVRAEPEWDTSTDDNGSAA